MSATLADIAKATGTSISTVSRVLTAAPAAKRISAATRARVVAAAREMGYRPNLLARSLRTRRTHTVALLVSDIANPWFGEIASDIEQALHRHGYSVIVCNSCEDAELEQEYLRLLPQKGIDGLIIVPLATTQAELMQNLSPTMPVVVMDRLVEGITASVTSDQAQAATLLCNELERAGVVSVGLVSGPQHVITHRQRAQAVRSRFKVVCEHEGPAQQQTGRSAWDDPSLRSADAVVCTNNFLGLGLMEAMNFSEKLPVVACFDELPSRHLLPLPIVCCVQDVPTLSLKAVEMLLSQLQKKSKVLPVSVPVRLVSNSRFQQRIAR